MNVRTVEIRRSRLVITVEVTIEGKEARGRMVSVATVKGEPVVEALDSDLVTEVTHEAIDRAVAEQAQKTGTDA